MIRSNFGKNGNKSSSGSKALNQFWEIEKDSIKFDGKDRLLDCTAWDYLPEVEGGNVRGGPTTPHVSWVEERQAERREVADWAGTKKEERNGLIYSDFNVLVYCSTLNS